MLGVPLCRIFEGSAVGPLPPNPPPPRSLGLVALRVPITTSERATLANDPCTVIRGIDRYRPRNDLVPLNGIGCPILVLNVSSGTASIRLLSEAMQKTNARREFFSP